MSERKHRNDIKVMSHKITLYNQKVSENLSGDFLQKSLEKSFNIDSQSLITTGKSNIDDMNLYTSDKNCKCCFIDENLMDKWTLTDHNIIAGFKPDINFVNKKYLYCSELAVQGDVYKMWSSSYVPLYKLKNTDKSFLCESPGISGTFIKDMTNNLDNSKYDSIFYNFCYTHILSTHAKIAINKCGGNSKSQDMIIERTINSTTQILQWYGKLIDSFGNKESYEQTTYQGQVKCLLDILINGIYVLKHENIVEQIRDFINLFKSIKEECHIKNIHSEIDKLESFLNVILRTNICWVKEIPLLSWTQLVAKYQRMTFESFLKLRKIYSTCKHDNIQYYNTLVSEMNEYTREFYDLGRQMAAFFAILYSVTIIFNKLQNETANADNMTQYVQESLTRWWYEHITIFYDYNKAAALNDDESMYKIQLHMLESCPYIAQIIGYILNKFNNVMNDTSKQTLKIPK